MIWELDRVLVRFITVFLFTGFLSVATQFADTIPPRPVSKKPKVVTSEEEFAYLLENITSREYNINRMMSNFLKTEEKRDSKHKGVAPDLESAVELLKKHIEKLASEQTGVSREWFVCNMLLAYGKHTLNPTGDDNGQHEFSAIFENSEALIKSNYCVRDIIGCFCRTYYETLPDGRTYVMPGSNAMIKKFLPLYLQTRTRVRHEPPLENLLIAGISEEEFLQIISSAQKTASDTFNIPYRISAVFGKCLNSVLPARSYDTRCRFPESAIKYLEMTIKDQKFKDKKLDYTLSTDYCYALVDITLQHLEPEAARAHFRELLKTGDLDWNMVLQGYGKSEYKYSMMTKKLKRQIKSLASSDAANNDKSVQKTIEELKKVLKEVESKSIKLTGEEYNIVREAQENMHKRADIAAISYSLKTQKRSWERMEFLGRVLVTTDEQDKYRLQAMHSLAELYMEKAAAMERQIKSKSPLDCEAVIPVLYLADIPDEKTISKRFVPSAKYATNDKQLALLYAASPALNSPEDSYYKKALTVMSLIDHDYYNGQKDREFKKYLTDRLERIKKANQKIEEIQNRKISKPKGRDLNDKNLSRGYTLQTVKDMNSSYDELVSLLKKDEGDYKSIPQKISLEVPVERQYSIEFSSAACIAMLLQYYGLSSADQLTVAAVMAKNNQKYNRFKGAGTIHDGYADFTKAAMPGSWLTREVLRYHSNAGRLSLKSLPKDMKERKELILKHLNMILQTLADKRPLLVYQKFLNNKTQYLYRVVTGYDLDKREFYQIDPLWGPETVPFTEFLSRSMDRKDSFQIIFFNSKHKKLGDGQRDTALTALPSSSSQTKPTRSPSTLLVSASVAPIDQIRNFNTEHITTISPKRRAQIINKKPTGKIGEALTPQEKANKAHFMSMLNSHGVTLEKRMADAALAKPWKEVVAQLPEKITGIAMTIKLPVKAAKQPRDKLFDFMVDNMHNNPQFYTYLKLRYFTKRLFSFYAGSYNFPESDVSPGDALARLKSKLKNIPAKETGTSLRWFMLQSAVACGSCELDGVSAGLAEYKTLFEQSDRMVRFPDFFRTAMTCFSYQTWLSPKGMSPELHSKALAVLTQALPEYMGLEPIMDYEVSLCDFALALTEEEAREVVAATLKQDTFSWQYLFRLSEFLSGLCLGEFDLNPQLSKPILENLIASPGFDTLSKNDRGNVFAHYLQVLFSLHENEKISQLLTSLGSDESVNLTTVNDTFSACRSLSRGMTREISFPGKSLVRADYTEELLQLLKKTPEEKIVARHDMLDSVSGEFNKAVRYYRNNNSNLNSIASNMNTWHACKFRARHLFSSCEKSKERQRMVGSLLSTFNYMGSRNIDLLKNGKPVSSITKTKKVFSKSCDYTPKPVSPYELAIPPELCPDLNGTDDTYFYKAVVVHNMRDYSNHDENEYVGIKAQQKYLGDAERYFQNIAECQKIQADNIEREARFIRSVAEGTLTDKELNEKEKCPCSFSLADKLKAFGITSRSRGKRNTYAALALTAAAEFAYAKAHPDSPRRFSPEYLVWAANESTGLSGDRTRLYEGVHGMNSLGLCLSDLFPYNQESAIDQKAPEAALINATPLAKLWRSDYIVKWDFKRKSFKSEMPKLRRALASGWPLLCVLRWPKGFNGYKLLDPNELSQKTEERTIMLVGYARAHEINVSNVFAFMNSEGPDWGINGYGVISDDFLEKRLLTAMSIKMLDAIQPEPTLHLEAENMKILGHSKGYTPSTPSMKKWGHGMWSNGRHLFINCKRRNSYIDLEFIIDTAGTYRITMNATNSYDFADLNVRIDKDEQTHTGSLYSGRVCCSEPLDLGEHILEPGKHRIHVRAAGKSSSSTNYYIGIDCFDFYLPKPKEPDVF